MIKFFDTCSLLDLQEEAFEEPFYISNLTLVELEDIKTSVSKDEDIKYRTRHLLRLIEKYEDIVNVVIYNNDWDYDIGYFKLIPNTDAKIIITAWNLVKDDEVIFITSDLSCKHIASFLGLDAQLTKKTKEDKYTGYIKVTLDDNESNDFYINTIPYNINKYNLLENQYLLVEYNNEITDKYKWTNNQYVKVPFIKIESKMFGKIIPKDAYQAIAMDSMVSNQITVMRGKAGSGKSYLALGYLLQELEKGHIDKILVFCNTVAVRGAAKLGYYPGSRNEKLLDSQIGNFLASKLGSITQVEDMIENGSLVLMPVSDCRGIDTTGMHAGIYVTEGQNLSVDMMKLILQRVGEDCICIIEGDDRTQVDMAEYNGSNNGLRKLSQVFRGQKIYGETTLNKIHRSRIAEIADKM